MEEVRGFFEAVTRQLSGSCRSAEQNQSNPAHSEPSGSRRLEKKKPKILLSSFLKKKTTIQKELEWDKDIICLPKDSSAVEKEIPIPRGM